MNSFRGRTSKTFGLVILLVAGAAVLSACGKKAPVEKSNEKVISDMMSNAARGKAEIDLKKGQLKVKTPEGDAVITSGGGSWPADLPEEITRFTRGSLQASTNSHLSSGDSWTMIFWNVEADAVAAYLEGLKNDGWKVTATTNVPQGAFTQVQMENLFMQLTYTANEQSLALTVIRQKDE